MTITIHLIDAADMVGCLVLSLCGHMKLCMLHAHSPSQSFGPSMQPLHLNVLFVYRGGAPWRGHGAGCGIAGQLWLSGGLCVRACVWAPWGRGFDPCCLHVFPRELWCPIFTARYFTKSNRDTHLVCYGNLVKHIKYCLHEPQDQMLVASVLKKF